MYSNQPLHFPCIPLFAHSFTCIEWKEEEKSCCSLLSVRYTCFSQNILWKCQVCLNLTLCIHMLFHFVDVTLSCSFFVLAFFASFGFWFCVVEIESTHGSLREKVKYRVINFQTDYSAKMKRSTKAFTVSFPCQCEFCLYFAFALSPSHKQNHTTHTQCETFVQLQKRVKYGWKLFWKEVKI